MGLHQGIIFEDVYLGRELKDINWEERLAFFVILRLVNDLKDPIPFDSVRMREALINKIDAWDSLVSGDICLWTDFLGIDYSSLIKNLTRYRPTRREFEIVENYRIRKVNKEARKNGPKRKHRRRS